MFRCPTRAVVAVNALLNRLARLLDTGLDLWNTRAGRIMVSDVVSILPVVRSLFKAAAGVSDSALRILASQEHVVIIRKNMPPTSARI